MRAVSSAMNVGLSMTVSKTARMTSSLFKMLFKVRVANTSRAAEKRLPTVI